MIHLRPATTDDADFLLRLRNDPETRQASIHSDEVLWADHLLWLDKNLKNRLVKIYICLDGDKPVGTVRTENDSTWYILSWTVAPEYRGKGFGKAMLMAITGATEGRLKAHIKSGNIASRKIAESVGMLLNTQTEDMCVYVLERANYIDNPM